MSLYDDFKKYRDKYGLNSICIDGNAGQVTQNGALFTLEYLLCLLSDPDTPTLVKQNEIERLKEVYRSLEKHPGVSSRTPGGTEFDSMDNTGAIAIFSGLCDRGGFSERSYEHGRDVMCDGYDDDQNLEGNRKYYWVANALGFFLGPRYFWNCNKPTKFCVAGWHGRSPGHIAILKLTAGKWVGPFGQLALLVGQFVGCFKEASDTDARKLPYCVWQFLKKRSFVWKLFYKLWCFILMKQYKNGMIDVYRAYYQDPSHPIHRYSKPYEP